MAEVDTVSWISNYDQYSLVPVAYVSSWNFNPGPGVVMLSFGAHILANLYVSKYLIKRKLMLPVTVTSALLLTPLCLAAFSPQPYTLHNLFHGSLDLRFQASTCHYTNIHLSVRVESPFFFTDFGTLAKYNNKIIIVTVKQVTGSCCLHSRHWLTLPYVTRGPALSRCVLELIA